MFRSGAIRFLAPRRTRRPGRSVSADCHTAAIRILHRGAFIGTMALATISLEEGIGTLAAPALTIEAGSSHGEDLDRLFKADRDLDCGGLTVAFADLDRFKELNDVYGLLAGDEMITSRALGPERHPAVFSQRSARLRRTAEALIDNADHLLLLETTSLAGPPGAQPHAVRRGAGADLLCAGDRADGGVRLGGFAVECGAPLTQPAQYPRRSRTRCR